MAAVCRHCLPQALGGVSAKCELVGFCLKLATSKKRRGVTPFARN